MSIPDNFMYLKLPSEPAPVRSSQSFWLSSIGADAVWIFDELPKAEIVSVSRPDVSDITPMLLSYIIEFHYKDVIFLFFFKGLRFVR